MTLKGKTAFQEYYRQLFPGSLYDRFIQSLVPKQNPVFIFHPRHTQTLRSLWKTNHLTWETLTWYESALIWPPEIEAPNPVPGYLEKWAYPLSSASIIPVLALDLQPTDLVLDACAAPGGKSLLISRFLDFPSLLVANDLSPQRIQIMHQLFYDYQLTDIAVMGGPAEHLWHRFPQTFDKILLHAPCSSEQHLYASPKHLSLWSPKRIQKLVHRQYLLIKMLLRCLKPGGILVYSTCAVTPAENELVIDRILTKFSSELSLVPFNSTSLPQCPGFSLPSLTYDHHHVFHSLPHRDRLDPMFVAIIKKNEA